MNSKQYFGETFQHLVRWALFSAALWMGILPCRASVPDWLNAVMREPVQEYAAATDAVVLLDEQQTLVSSDGKLKTTTRRAIRILREEAKERYDQAVVDFDSETQITYLKGWSIAADGNEYPVKERDTIETSLSPEANFQDTRYKVIRFPAVKPGTVIAYEYQQNRRPSILQDLWEPQWKIPVRHARYTLQLPNGWQYRQAWLNGPAHEPVNNNQNQFVWELKDVAGIPAEPKSPPIRALAIQLGLTFMPPEKASAHTFSSWAEVAHWHSELAASSMQDSPEINAEVNALTGGASSTDEKIHAISNYVQRQIRYVAIEVGIGGYQPHPAASTFSNKYGDCKDKATLLVNMLGQAGIKAHPVAINATRGVVRSDFPSPYQFNHMIVAIELPVDSKLATSPAALDVAPFGRLLFFDPTAEAWPAGILVDELQGNTGLLIAGDSSQLVTLPTAPASGNHLLRTGEFSLAPEGTLTGKITETYSGSWAARMREELAAMDQTEKKKLIDLLATRLPGSVTVTHAEIQDQRQISNSLVLRYEVRAADYAQLSGDLMHFRPQMAGRITNQIYEWKSPEGQGRTLPVDNEFTGVYSELNIVQLPAGYQIDELPEPAQLKESGFAYKSAFEVKGGRLTSSRDFTIADLTVPSSELDAVRTFYRRLRDDEQKTVVLKREK